MWPFLLLSVLAVAAHGKSPNIVFVLTDDQDWHMDSLKHMPLVNKDLIGKGTVFDKHYCTVSICCPSRVNLWTGRAAHNTNVTDVFPPYGGYPIFVEQGLNDNWLPVWLQNGGYNTYYVGKLFNSHSMDNYDKVPVNGFNGSEFQLDPHTYDYWNTWMTRNGEPPVSYKGQYSPDVVAQKAYDFLDEAVLDDRPFFLAVAPIAPHANKGFSKPEYAVRHAHLFKDYVIPRTADFNPDVHVGVSWMKNLNKMNDTIVEYNDEFQRSRLRALQSVDEMVGELVLRLENIGILENTYIIYSSDNGYHIGHHRLPPGKQCPFETDVHVPLVIRGPGVPPGQVAGVVSSHTDLTPTILKIAGVERGDLDGSPVPLTVEDLTQSTSGEHVNIEFWGTAYLEGDFRTINGSLPLGLENTYKTIRLIGDDYNLMYTVWCTGERQFFDMTHDPYQVHNYFDADEDSRKSYKLQGRPLEQVLSRLDALLMVTKSCKAQQCREPWRTLHPYGDVSTLQHALHMHFDTFYAAQPRVSFSSCSLGYILSEEGPQLVNSWTGAIKGNFKPPTRGGNQQIL